VAADIKATHSVYYILVTDMVTWLQHCNNNKVSY